MKLYFVIMALLLSLLPSTSACADEHAVSRAQVPKAVLEAVGKKYPSAKQTRFAKETEGDKVTFEVVVQDGARKVDVALSPDGKILEEEEVIPLSALPEAVTKALSGHATYASWKAKRAERVVKSEAAPRFEIVVTKGKKAAELLFEQDGRLIKDSTEK